LSVVLLMVVLVKIKPMAKYLIAFAALFCCLNGYAQSEKYGVNWNFGMEEFKADSTWTEPIHKGYIFKVDTSVKYSGRQSILISSTESVGASKFCPIWFSRRAKYLGKEIEFKGWLKFENVTGFASIMIDEHDADGSYAHNSLNAQKMHGTQGWNLYSVKVQLDTNAQFISFGCMLGGSGKLWMDDMQLLIDGKDITQAALNPNYNPNHSQHPKYDNNPATGGWVKLKDADLYYETYGTGEPLLLLHGDSQSIFAFVKQIP
jgi:hypothetical protein